MKIRFVKYNALGNDYLILDPLHLAASMQHEPDPKPMKPMKPTKLAELVGLAELAAELCDRHSGVGADGLLYGPLQQQAPFALRIFNSDGSEAEKSGNGLRIFARYLLDAGYCHADRFELLTCSGLASIEVTGQGLLRVGLGSVSFIGAVSGVQGELIDYPIEVNGKRLHVNCLSLGNPHCVILVKGDENLQVLARQLGPAIECHPLFPHKTNVQFLRIKDRTKLELAIWERGSGYTLSSGSSSAAASAVAHRLGLINNKVEVDMAGGSLVVELGAKGQVAITGGVKKVAEGYFFKSDCKTNFQSKL